MLDIDTNFISMYDLVICLTSAFDLVSPELSNHHQQVAYLSFRIAEQMGLPDDIKKNIALSGLLHDVGALSLNERLELIENEPPTVNNHAFVGAKLLSRFPPLDGAANIIRYHHVPWNNGKGTRFAGKDVPAASHILHLADRISVSIDRKRNVIGQINDIKSKIAAQKNTVFMPDAVDAFLEISNREYIWLDMLYKPLLYILPQIIAFDVLALRIDEVIDLTKIFSDIIDFRSPFTANHSAGVAATAKKLAELMGFSKKGCNMMLIAGYLHDLGKLAVNNEILEKPGSLNNTEFNVIKSHPFYTYRLLQSIKGFETINQWASFHHEKLDGTGYPFHLSGDNLPLGSRIMAVADIFTAITEDRPYRLGMDEKKASGVLRSMAEKGAISPQAVSVLIDNFGEIDKIRKKAQREASQEYRCLLDNAG